MLSTMQVRMAQRILMRAKAMSKNAVLKKSNGLGYGNLFGITALNFMSNRFYFATQQ